MPDAAADLLARVFDSTYLEALAERILGRLAASGNSGAAEEVAP